MAGGGRRVGFATGLLSAATFGTSGVFATGLLRAGWTAGAAVTARVLVAALVLTGPAVVALRGRWHLLRRGGLTVAGYGLGAVAACQLCYFKAIRDLSVAVALLMEYSGILLVVLWLWLRHGHRPRPLTIAGSVAALGGLVLVLRLFGDHHLNVTGLLWAAGAATGLAVYFLVSAGADSALPPLVVAWGGLGVGGVVLAVLGAAGALSMRAPRVDVTLGHARLSWLVAVLGLSLIAAVIAYVAGITAARSLGAKLASFLGLTEVLFAVVFAWLLLGEQLTAGQLVGGALVVAGIALVRLDEFREPAAVVSEPAARPADVAA